MCEHYAGILGILWSIPTNNVFIPTFKSSFVLLFLKNIVIIANYQKCMSHLNFHAKNIICKLRLFEGFSNTVRQGCTEALLDF